MQTLQFVGKAPKCAGNPNGDDLTYGKIKVVIFVIFGIRYWAFGGGQPVMMN